MNTFRNHSETPVSLSLNITVSKVKVCRPLRWEIKFTQYNSVIDEDT